MNNSLLNLCLKFSRITPKSVLNMFSNLKLNLVKASMRTGFEAYLGLMLFTSLITTVIVFLTSIFMMFLLNFQLLPSLVFSLLFGIIGWSISVGISYSYPILVASSRGRKIDASLPITANFMSVLASAGLTPEDIIRSLAAVGTEFNLNKETANILRDIDLMGSNFQKALKKASEISPSKKFATMLDGVITTSHMGGNLTGYLSDQAEKYKRNRMLNMKSFLDNLSVVAEAYVTYMVAAPLMLIVMLSVMSFIGGEITLANLDPVVLLNLLAFVFIPAGIGILILIVDTITPPR